MRQSSTVTNVWVVLIPCRLIMITVALLLVLHSAEGFRQDAVFRDRPWYEDYLLWKQGTDVFVRSYGLSFEWEYVTTEDDCTLALHHVWNPKVKGSRVPVLFVHALIADGDSWFISKPSNSLAMVMAKNGYDVWALNYRAMPYSPIEADQYVNTTMDDNALKDLPASIDFILQKTGHPNLNLVSMSKGGYVSMALLSSKPEYNSKVRLHYTMVPVNAVTQPRGWIKYFMEFHRFMVGKLGDIWVRLFDSNHLYFNFLHVWEFPLYLQKLAQTLPTLEQRIVNSLWNARFELGELNMDTEIISKALKRGFPTVWFGREMIQFSQNAFTKMYQRYSPSWMNNPGNVYRTSLPDSRPFDMSRIKAPHIMLQANTEIFSSPADNERIRNGLCHTFISGPHAAKYVFEVDVPNYQHVDPLVGGRSAELYVNAIYMTFRDHDIALNKTLRRILPKIEAEFKYLKPQPCTSIR